MRPLQLQSFWFFSGRKCPILLTCHPEFLVYSLQLLFIYTSMMWSSTSFLFSVLSCFKKGVGILYSWVCAPDFLAFSLLMIVLQLLFFLCMFTAPITYTFTLMYLVHKWLLRQQQEDSRWQCNLMHFHRHYSSQGDITYLLPGSNDRGC